MPKTIYKLPTPSLWVSQNLITSRRTIRKVINLTSINGDDHVVEIGPGKGHLTEALLLRAGTVTAVEADGAMYARCMERLGGRGNLRLHHCDFFGWGLPAESGYKVFSNIPFSRTTDIVRRLTESPNPPDEAWLFMERGAAMRFMGLPREGVCSLLLKPIYDVRITYRFRRGDFHPMPSVDVVLLHLRLKRTPDIPMRHMGAYRAFIRGRLSGRVRLTARRSTAGCVGADGRRTGDTMYVQWLCLFRRRAGL